MDIIDLKREIETLKSFKRRKMLTKVGIEKLTDLNKQLKALTIPVVSISLERAKKYARHQHFLGTQGKDLVEFEDWQAKD